MVSIPYLCIEKCILGCNDSSSSHVGRMSAISLSIKMRSARSTASSSSCKRKQQTINFEGGERSEYRQRDGEGRGIGYTLLIIR